MLLSESSKVVINVFFVFQYLIIIFLEKYNVIIIPEENIDRFFIYIYNIVI